ncbi:MAG: hydroxymethylpyrimidine kinase / phosphomethylpyrimidine kinase / thiamine-phosphate diphosphorylase, partial [Actinomycetota bacterium]
MGTPVVTPPVALTIAGVDSSGGAGVAADLATFGAEGVWGACAVTAITAQNSLGVDAIELMLPEMVDAQMLAVCTDMRVAAIKTGMLGSAELAAVVVRRLPRGVPVVVDPVMVATTGARLADAGGFGALLERAALVTPNAFEVKALTGVVILSDDDMERAGRALLELGSAAALVKGGHVGQTGGSARDCLVIAGQPGVIWLESERVPTEDTHGTGCVLSAAITARLARGDD